MDFFTLLLVASAIGLGVVVLWLISGLNVQYSGFVGSIMQGIVVTPFLGVGGVAAFLLFGHLAGVPDVQHLGTDTIMDVLSMVGITSAFGGIGLGLLGYFVSLVMD